jgi:CDP-4-dehydro-6-deoxyglucose reductase, E1
VRAEIIKKSQDFFKEKFKDASFVPGETYIPVTGKVLDDSDGAALIEASLDMWLTAGRFANQFERELPKVFGKKLSKLTVSGSAANLLAFATLTSWKLGEARIKPGSEVITVAAGFPTTVAPIVQYGCIPVFVDIDLETHNINEKLIEEAVSTKTSAIMLAHSLGNPFNVRKVKEICEKYNLYLIEDCCDAFGATVTMQDGSERGVGTFGELATLSFYPAHHITMGEGGAVLMDSMKLGRICESFRDWGRDCYCAPGNDNTCKKRFDWQLGELPEGYDHKYTYSHLGYNLKVSDMQAAVGVSQLKKIDLFVAARRKNFTYLNSLFLEKGLDEFFHLPRATDGTNPSWFGYLLTLKKDLRLSRREIVQRLECAKVGTRLLFAGNLSKQPAFKDVSFRISGSLDVTDYVMESAFWVGVWPGLREEHLQYIVKEIEKIVKR